jgi:hypothetical protein
MVQSHNMLGSLPVAARKANGWQGGTIGQWPRDLARVMGALTMHINPKALADTNWVEKGEILREERYSLRTTIRH